MNNYKLKKTGPNHFFNHNKKNYKLTVKYIFTDNSKIIYSSSIHVYGGTYVLVLTYRGLRTSKIKILRVLF